MVGSVAVTRSEVPSIGTTDAPEISSVVSVFTADPVWTV